MQTIEFSKLPVGAIFYDYAYSGDWMKKLDHESARFEDGLIGIVAPSCPVQISEYHASR